MSPHLYCYCLSVSPVLRILCLCIIPYVFILCPVKYRTACCSRIFFQYHVYYQVISSYRLYPWNKWSEASYHHCWLIDSLCNYELAILVFIQTVVPVESVWGPKFRGIRAILNDIGCLFVHILPNVPVVSVVKKTSDSLWHVFEVLWKGLFPLWTTASF